MSLLRILVNGDRLLEDWTKLAATKTRRPALAREELVSQLTRYYDACGVPITVAFDQLQSSLEVDTPPSRSEVEVVCSPAGQKVDQFLEKLARRLISHGSILLVTNTPAGPSTLGPSCQISTCSAFLHTVEDALRDLEHNITVFNEKERAQFNRTH